MVDSLFYIWSRWGEYILDFVTICGAMVGSLIVASNIGYNMIGYGFYLMSSLAALILLYKKRGPGALIVTNVWFIGVNVFGMIRA